MFSNSTILQSLDHLHAGDDPSFGHALGEVNHVFDDIIQIGDIIAHPNDAAVVDGAGPEHLNKVFKQRNIIPGCIHISKPLSQLLIK